MVEILVDSASSEQHEYDDIRLEAPAGPGPMLAEVATLMQEGRWAEAASTLDAIEAQFDGCAPASDMREMLSLHLSAEESWQAGAPKPPAWLRSPIVHLLLVANVLLYLMLGSLLLLVDMSQSSH